jgi:DNA invertase Pin-like site-specific DNA recombinase
MCVTGCVHTLVCHGRGSACLGLNQLTRTERFVFTASRDGLQLRMPRPRKARSGDPRIAIAYLRVSRPDQKVMQQRDAIERWAASAGVRILQWCADEGVSGATPLDLRPALLEALSAVRTHGAGLLVGAKRDRLARDVSNCAAIERLTAEAGARVVTADGLDASDTPEGQLVRCIIDAMGQYERALIRARTKAALTAKAKRGEVIGSTPFGSRALAGKLVPDAQEQGALARMRELKAAGASNGAIADKLTAEGHKPRGQRWHTTTVQRALVAKV